MAPRSPEAIARKRERNRQWERNRRRIQPRKVEIYAQDERWFTLTCSRCFRLFDVPRASVRLRELCEECRR